MQRQNKGRQTRELIINEAVLLFTRNGYGHTSLAEILEATGLTKGGFYFHFKSKEDLGNAVINTLKEYWQNVLLPNIASGKNAHEKLQILLSAPGDCHTNPDCMRPTLLLLNLAIEMIEVHDPFTKRLKNILDEWWFKIEEIIDEGKTVGLFESDLNSHAVAAIILSTIMGSNLLALLNGDPGIYKNQLSSLQHILFNRIAI